MFVSAIALLVSAISTIATWRQADLMQEQMRAGDRNNAVSKVIESVLDLCDGYQQIPINHHEWPYPVDTYRGRLSYGYSYADVDNVAKDADLAFVNGIKEKRRRVSTNLSLLAVWLPPQGRETIYTAMSHLRSLYDPDLANRSKDVMRTEYHQSVSDTYECHNLYVGLAADIAGFNVQPFAENYKIPVFFDPDIHKPSYYTVKYPKTFDRE